MKPVRDRAKLTTAVGILTMLFGAMFILAPAAGAQVEHRVTICHRTNAVTNPYVVITVDYDGATGQVLGQGANDHNVHTGEVFDEEATYEPPFDNDDWGDIIPPVPYGDGQMTTGLNWTGDGPAINANGCNLPNEDPEDTTLRVVKAVNGNNAPATWSFPFDWTIDDDFSLTNAAPSTDTFIVDPDTYVLTETNNQGATSTSISCTGATDTSLPAGAEHDISVELTEGDDAVCTFTNTFTVQIIPGCVDDPATEEDECNPVEPTPDPASLTVVKAVAGDDAPDDWTFPFTVTNLGDVDLTDEDPDFQEIELDAGNYTITESDAGDADLTGITCSDGADVLDTTIADDGSTGSVSVALDEGDAVTCTFTNTFPDVEGSVVVNPPTPAPAADEPAGLGEPVVRTLPRTGSTNGPLAVLGVALLLVGATLVGGSRLRLRYVD